MGRPSRAGVAASQMIGVKVTPDEHATAKRLAEERGATVGDLVRAWIELAAGGVLREATPAPAPPIDPEACVHHLVARGDIARFKPLWFAVTRAEQALKRIGLRVACPVDGCRAAAGGQCTGMVEGYEVRQNLDPHPARVELAVALVAKGELSDPPPELAAALAFVAMAPPAPRAAAPTIETVAAELLERGDLEAAELAANAIGRVLGALRDREEAPRMFRAASYVRLAPRGQKRHHAQLDEAYWSRERRGLTFADVLERVPYRISLG